MKTTRGNFIPHLFISAVLANFSFAEEPEPLQSLNQIRKNIERFSPIFKEEPILSKSSSTAIKQLKEPVKIEVFLSPKENFPQSLLHRRLSVLSLIDQISETEPRQVQSVIHEIEEYDPLALIAEKLGVSSVSNWMPNQDIPNPGKRKHYFGAAIKGSQGKQIIPYFGTVSYLENELIGSIVDGSTVKKKIGIFKTDAPIMGSAGMSMMGMNVGGASPPWEFALAMKKRYELRSISEKKDSKTEYDAMVVVQPSLLGESGIDHLVSLVKSGVPTVILEDPLPVAHKFPGTYEPRAEASISGLPPSSPKPPEKGDLSKLWKLLEVNFCEIPGDERKLVLSDFYNPFPVIQRSNMFPEEFVYAGGFENAFGSSVVSKEVKHLLFNCSGFISPRKDSNLSFEPIVSSGKKTGFTQADTFWSNDRLGIRNGFNPSKTKVPGTGKQQVIAAKITGKPKGSVSDRELSVILVSDTDFMADNYYQLAKRPVNPSFPLKVQNTSFALELIDHMAKNQNRVGSLGGKYEAPKVTTEQDSILMRIREEYERRIEEERQSRTSLIQREEQKVNLALAEQQARYQANPQPDSMSLLRNQMLNLQSEVARKTKEINDRSERVILGVNFERDKLIAILEESPFSGWVRVFDHNGRFRIERNYLSGKPHGVWKRMDTSGKEVFNKKYLNENPAFNNFNVNEFQTQRSLRLQKQQVQAERIRKLFAE